jgi:hypothetical protein
MLSSAPPEISSVVLKVLVLLKGHVGGIIGLKLPLNHVSL